MTLASWMRIQFEGDDRNVIASQFYPRIKSALGNAPQDAKLYELPGEQETVLVYYLSPTAAARAESILIDLKGKGVPITACSPPPMDSLREMTFD
jgi:hypothetical protein